MLLRRPFVHYVFIWHEPSIRGCAGPAPQRLRLGNLCAEHRSLFLLVRRAG